MFFPHSLCIVIPNTWMECRATTLIILIDENNLATLRVVLLFLRATLTKETFSALLHGPSPWESRKCRVPHIKYTPQGTTSRPMQVCGAPPCGSGFTWPFTFLAGGYKLVWYLAQNWASWLAVIGSQKYEACITLDSWLETWLLLTGVSRTSDQVGCLSAQGLSRRCITNSEVPVMPRTWHGLET